MEAGKEEGQVEEGEGKEEAEGEGVEGDDHVNKRSRIS